MMKPCGCSMYISSSSTPLRNADLTSSWWISQSSSTANTSNNLIDSKCATGEKVSSSSTPGICVNPFATRQVWWRPSAFSLNTHLDFTALQPDGRSTSSHVLFLDKASISYLHALVQSAALSDPMASAYDAGSLPT